MSLEECYFRALLQVFAYDKSTQQIPVNDEKSNVKQVIMDSRTGIYVDRHNAYYIAPGAKKDGNATVGHMVGKLKRNAEEEIVSITYFENVPAEIKKALDTCIKTAKKKQNPVLSC